MEIVGEALLRVSHSLIAGELVALEEIETVITHPQVPGQCTRFLRDELARARVLPASSTAEAVRTVGARRGRAHGGARAPCWPRASTAATVLRERRRGPRRQRDALRLAGAREAGRRVDAAAAARRDAAAQWKTSLVFWGAGAERPGWLVRCLDEFARRDINLTKIESRPRRDGLGSYMFFADLAGELQEQTRRGGDRRSAGDLRGRSRARLLPAAARRAALTPAARHARAPRGADAPATLRRRRWRAQSHQSRWGPCRLQSTSGTDLAHRRHRRWVAGCSCSNATYEPINVCTVRRAVVLLLKEKAELLERGRWQLHSESSTLARPVVIRLVSYVQGAARRAPAQDHAPRGVRARQLDLPVLRLALQPDGRPRDPALQGRLLELGEHRRLVRAVQPAQGRPAAAPGGDAPAPRAAHAASGDLHPRGQPDDPDGLAGSTCRRRPEPLRAGA